MSRVIALVEGLTEQTFVRDIIAPQLALQGIMLSARLVGKPGRKGGVGAYERTRRDILTILGQSADVFCTTMFDYYGMPHDWTGRREAQTLPHTQKSLAIEQAMAENIYKGMGTSFKQERFIPYVQMHEFEALLFTEPSVIAEVMQQPNALTLLQNITNQFTSPEMINDNVLTAPSKRLEKLFPTYKKVFHGNLIAQHIELSTIRTQCPHFNDWLMQLARLESRD